MLVLGFQKSDANIERHLRHGRQPQAKSKFLWHKFLRALQWKIFHMLCNSVSYPESAPGIWIHFKSVISSYSKFQNYLKFRNRWYFSFSVLAQDKTLSVFIGSLPTNKSIIPTNVRKVPFLGSKMWNSLKVLLNSLSRILVAHPMYSKIKRLSISR